MSSLYYTYYQNNSGGRFDEDDRVCQYVIIQAVSAADADCRAKTIGIYFDGVEKGLNCECCGDRWDTASAGTEQSEIYGLDPREHDSMQLTFDYVCCRIYHLDGTVTEVLA